MITNFLIHVLHIDVLLFRGVKTLRVCLLFYPCNVGFVLFYVEQIDARILRAVALEHKDVGDAVDAVLSHVIPFLSSVNGNLSDSAEGISAGGSSQG